MKKLLVVLGVVAFGFAFTSCKKDCKCSGTVKMEAEGMDPMEQKIDFTTPDKMSKSDCESYVYKYDAAIPGATVTSDVKCKAE